MFYLWLLSNLWKRYTSRHIFSRQLTDSLATLTDSSVPCNESWDIGQKVSKIGLPNQTSKIWHFLADILRLVAYFSKPIFGLKIVLHQRLSSIEGRLPTEGVFHWRTPSIEGRPQKRKRFQKGSQPKEWSWHWPRKMKTETYKFFLCGLV